ncbi:hypothetical protein DC522_24685 [Microvirga sp. KLBC 81]|nr:hypothetical protein DC522_24685 [Microvirga sp. KLBC 81]
MLLCLRSLALLDTILRFANHGIVSMKHQAIEVQAPHLRDSSTSVNAWTRDTSVPQPQNVRRSEEAANPIYILAAITLGIPALLMIPLIGMNPGVQEGTLSTLTMLLVFSAFISAAVFEIKRLADQPSDAGHR